MKYKSIYEIIAEDENLLKNFNDSNLERYQTSREDLLKKVRNCTPNLGWDYEYPNLFGRYGTMDSNIGDKWIWYNKEDVHPLLRAHGKRPLEEATDRELLEMWAMTSEYWYKTYKKWYEDFCQKLNEHKN